MQPISTDQFMRILNNRHKFNVCEGSSYDDFIDYMNKWFQENDLVFTSKMDDQTMIIYMISNGQEILHLIFTDEDNSFYYDPQIPYKKDVSAFKLTLDLFAGTQSLLTDWNIDIVPEPEELEKQIMVFSDLRPDITDEWDALQKIFAKMAEKAGIDLSSLSEVNFEIELRGKKQIVKKDKKKSNPTEEWI